jgi:hypothetical protein
MNREESNHSIGNEDGQEEDLDEASVTEARNKFLMALKGSFWELFEVNQISGDSLILLMQAANFDIDNAGQRMNSWEFISMGLINKQYMNTLFKLKFTPLIGRIARNLLFNHISSAYDIVIGYIESHEKAEAIFRQFPLDERIITEIVTESNESKESAERYLHNYLTVSFPEITQQIQNKKAATTVLEQQKSQLFKKIKSFLIS